MMPNQKYQHIFFDLDHTLWDFEKNSKSTLKILFNEFRLLNKNAISFPDFYNCYVTNNQYIWEKFLASDLNPIDFQWEKVRLTLNDFNINDPVFAHAFMKRFREIHPIQHILIPHTVQILKYLQIGYNLYLLTNGPKEIQMQKMQSSGIFKYFDKIIASDECGFYKPQHQIFDRALEITGANVQNSLMIGDSLEIDINGAANAGWDQVYYNRLKKEHNFSPTFEIHKLSELSKIL